MSTSPVTMDFLAARSIFHLWLLITLVLAKVVQTRASTKELRAKFKVTNTGSGPYGAFVPNVDTFRMEQMIRLNSSIMEELVVFIGDRGSPNMYTICQIVLDKCVCPPLSTIKDGCYCLYCDGTEIKFIIQVLWKAFMQGQKITVERQKKDDPNSRSLVAQKALPMICVTPVPVLYIDNKMISLDRPDCLRTGPPLGKKIRIIFCVMKLNNPFLELRFDQHYAFESHSQCINTEVVFQREHLGTHIHMSYSGDCKRNTTSCKLPSHSPGLQLSTNSNLLKPLIRGSCMDGSFVADVDIYRFKQTIKWPSSSLADVEVFVGKRGLYKMYTVCKILLDKCLCPNLSTKSGCCCTDVSGTMYTFMIQLRLESYMNRKLITVEGYLRNETQKRKLLVEKPVPRIFGTPYPLLFINNKKASFDNMFCLRTLPILGQKNRVSFCVGNLKNPYLEVRIDPSKIFKSNSTCIYTDMIFHSHHLGGDIQMIYKDDCLRHKTLFCTLPTKASHSVNEASAIPVTLDVLAMLTLGFFLLTNEAWTTHC